MSNFAYYFPLGVVASLTVIPHEWFEQVEQNLVKTANFTDGSTHAPSSPVIVGGSGMTIALVGGNTLSSGYLQIAPGADLSVSAGGQFHSYGDALFFGANYFVTTTEFSSGSQTTFNAGSFLNVHAAVEFTGPFGANAIVAADLQATNSVSTAILNVSSNATFSGPVINYGSVDNEGQTNLNFTQCNDLIVMSGAARVAWRPVIGTDSDSTYSTSSADLVYIPAGAISGPRTYHLDDVGAEQGSTIRFHRADNNTSTPISLRRTSDNAQLCVLTWQVSGYIWTDVVFINGAWRQVGGQFGEAV